MMDADEKEIFRYLKSQPGVFVTMNVISRHAAGKNRFNESPVWARAVLMRMAERNILQKDATGAYQLMPVPNDLGASPQWVSPQIAELLLRSGKKIAGAGCTTDDDEAYYDSL